MTYLAFFLFWHTFTHMFGHIIVICVCFCEISILQTFRSTLLMWMLVIFDDIENEAPSVKFCKILSEFASFLRLGYCYFMLDNFLHTLVSCAGAGCCNCYFADIPRLCPGGEIS